MVGDGINQIDATGEGNAAHLAERLRQIRIELLFTGLKKQVLDTFERTGCTPETQIGSSGLRVKRSNTLGTTGRGSSSILPSTSAANCQATSPPDEAPASLAAVRARYAYIMRKRRKLKLRTGPY